jgi:hypothetical protein
LLKNVTFANHRINNKKNQEHLDEVGQKDDNGWVLVLAIDGYLPFEHTVLV